MTQQKGVSAANSTAPCFREMHTYNVSRLLAPHHPTCGVRLEGVGLPILPRCVGVILAQGIHVSFRLHLDLDTSIQVDRQGRKSCQLGGSERHAELVVHARLVRLSGDKRTGQEWIKAIQGPPTSEPYSRRDYASSVPGHTPCPRPRRPSTWTSRLTLGAPPFSHLHGRAGHVETPVRHTHASRFMWSHCVVR